MGQSEKENWLTSHENLVDKSLNNSRNKKKAFLLRIKCDGLVSALLSNLTLGSKLEGGSIWGLEGNSVFLRVWYQGYFQNLTDAEQRHHSPSSLPIFKPAHHYLCLTSLAHTPSLLHPHTYQPFIQPSHSSVGKTMIFVLVFFYSFFCLLLFFFLFLLLFLSTCIFYVFFFFYIVFLFFLKMVKFLLDRNNKNVLKIKIQTRTNPCIWPFLSIMVDCPTAGFC